MSQADENEPLLPPEEEAALLGALQAALRPTSLDDATNERLIELALEDPLAPPSAEELVESARLREALAGGRPHPDADILRELGASFTEPRADDAAALERTLRHALERDAAPPRKPRTNIVYAMFGGGSLLAAAAALALLVSPTREAPPAPAAAVMPMAALVKPRSTVALFGERFDTANTTARIDRIASARSRDLRDNRYASWGVR